MPERFSKIRDGLSCKWHEEQDLSSVCNCSVLSEICSWLKPVCLTHRYSFIFIGLAADRHQLIRSLRARAPRQHQHKSAHHRQRLVARGTSLHRYSRGELNREILFRFLFTSNFAQGDASEPSVPIPECIPDIRVTLELENALAVEFNRDSSLAASFSRRIRGCSRSFLGLPKIIALARMRCYNDYQEGRA